MNSSKIVLLLCLSFFSVCAHAQTIKKPLFNFGVSAGTSTAFNDFIPGADLRLIMPASKHLAFSLLASAGYTHLYGKYIVTSMSASTMSSIVYSYVDMLPLKAGARFFPARNFYIAADAGIAFPVGSKIEDAMFMTLAPAPAPPTISKTGNAPALRSTFVYSPSIGITLGKHWDLSVKFEDFTRYNTLFAFRAGYNL